MANIGRKDIVGGVKPSFSVVSQEKAAEKENSAASWEITALSTNAVSKQMKEEAFFMRLNDLVEAKIMRIDNYKITIVLEGLAQVAYEVSLHYARYEAHVYTVKWYQHNCTPLGESVLGARK